MNIDDIRNTVICGDCLEVMKQMPDDSVNCCISSPPYFGLRDYGVDGQLGLEKTPEEFIGKLVAVFREVRRVLRDDGTCFVNLGDSYFSSNGRREDACGTSGKEPVNYQENDYLCGSLCDECRKAYLIGKSRSDNLRVPMPKSLLCETNHGHTESQTDHLPTSDSLNRVNHNEDAIPDSVNLEVPLSERHPSSSLSMPCESSLQPLGASNQISSDASCPLCGKPSVSCVLECGRMLACTLNIDSLSGASSRHTLDKFSLDSAYQHLTTTFQFSQVLKPKDLVGIPWRFAFAAQADGWYLRQDIIWHKPNPMPESVTDRCTKSHEYIFLLTKSARYFYDNEAIKEDATTKPHSPGWSTSMGDRNDRQVDNESNSREWAQNGKANKRSVWTVTTKSFNEAHFATFPEKLIEPCVLAGCPEGGIILDPFFGAGTTGLVAYKNRRDYIGIELNPDYIEISERRLQDEKDKLALFEGIR